MEPGAATAIRASVIDGIALTPRFRERGLAALHGALERSRAELLETIQQDAAATKEEALFQYLLTLNAIKVFHGTVHPQTCNELEYRIAQSKDHRDQRRPYGYAYITPPSNDELYSTVVAVAAALAAGNCVLVQRHAQPTQQLSPALEQLLTKSLSSEVFAYVSQDPFDSAFQSQHRVTLQAGQAAEPDNAAKSIRCTASQTVAIVDRSADLKAAARDCVHARFAFGGRSAYAPDIVLVNDFAVNEFASAVAEAALQYLTGHATSQPSSRAPNGSRTSTTSPQDPSTALATALEQSSTILASGAAGKVLLLHSRPAALLTSKLLTPTLAILPITSVDDAIDLLNSSSSSSSSPNPLTAAYIYAAPPVAKYAAQFLRTALSLVNHIPPSLLVGPPAPAGYAPAVHPRFTPAMFSAAAPALVEQPPELRALRGAIWPGRETGRGGRELEELVDGKLTPAKEPMGPAVGFFEQGFLFGASLVLSSVVVGCALSFRYGVPVLLARMSR